MSSVKKFVFAPLSVDDPLWSMDQKMAFHFFTCHMDAQDSGEIASAFGVSLDRLVRLKQVHGHKVIQVDTPLTELKQGDALVTRTRQLALGVVTADCAPVLLYAPDIQAVAAIHAGWRGMLRGVITETLKTLQDQGADMSQLTAYVGPCIGLDSYEMDQPVYDLFAKDKPQALACFHPGKTPGKYQLDMKGLAVHELCSEGVENVHISPVDTYATPQDYYSHRRATHLNEPLGQHQISVIMLRESE